MPGIGRFASADSLVPNSADPQSLNRYSYVYNNPLNATDPSGHCPWCLITGAIGGAITGATYYLTTPPEQQNRTDAALAIGAGFAGGFLIGTGIGTGAGIAVIASVGTGTGIALSAESYMINNGITGGTFDTSDFVVGSAVGGVEGAIAPFTGAGSILVSGVATGLQSVISDKFNGNPVNYQLAASATVSGLISGGIGRELAQVDIGGFFTPRFGQAISPSVPTFNVLPYPITDPIVKRLGTIAPLTKASTFTRGVFRNFISGNTTELFEGYFQRGTTMISDQFSKIRDEQ